VFYSYTTSLRSLRVGAVSNCIDGACDGARGAARMAEVGCLAGGPPRSAVGTPPRRGVAVPYSSV
jgi:hypothetical protein